MKSSRRRVNYVGMSGPTVRGKPTLTSEERLQRKREYVHAWVAKRRGWLSEYRLKQGCVDCGYRDHVAALDFDHNGAEKSFSIMRDGVNRSWNNLMVEVEKCDVVCANCHRIRTYNKLNNEDEDGIL